MTDPTPPLTEAEEQAMDDYEDAVAVRVDQPHTALIKDRVQSSRAAAVAAIRAAHEERVRERVLREVEAELRGIDETDLNGGAHYGIVECLFRVAALRGEGAR